MLLLLGVARAATLVLHDPAVGYANQYDMAFRSSCLGFWPDAEDDRKAATPAAPIPRYRFGEAVPQDCMLGTEVLLAGAAIATPYLLTDGAVDIRWLGGGKLLLMMLIGLYFHRELRGNTTASILHAAIFTVLLCDPFNTLFFNTLYTEASALLGIYLALGSLLVAVEIKNWPRRLIAAWLLGLLFLGFSRKAHLLLPALLILPAYFAIGAARKKLWLATIGIALLVIVVQARGLQKFSAHADANIVNTVFGTVLTATNPPEIMNQQLGLPANCARLANVSWYRTRGLNLKEACPEGFALSRLDIVQALLAQPSATSHLLFRSLHQSSGWRLPYLGEVAGENNARVAGLFGVSLASLVAAVSFAVYAAFFLGPLFAGAMAFAVLFSERTGGRKSSEHDATQALHVGLLCTAIVAGTVYLTALVGDGYSEFTRHAHLAHNMNVVAWLLMAALLFSGIRQRRRAVWAWLTCLALLPVGIQHWVSVLPLGSGMLVNPSTQTASPGAIEVSGWVADPNGVAQVTIETDKGGKWVLNTSTAHATAEYFPVGESPVEFSQILDLSGAKAGDELRLMVLSTTGQTTLIDRRWLK